MEKLVVSKKNLFKKKACWISLYFDQKSVGSENCCNGSFACCGSPNCY